MLIPLLMWLVGWELIILILEGVGGGVGDRCFPVVRGSCCSQGVGFVMDDLCLYCLWRRDLIYISFLSFLMFHFYIGRKAKFHFLIF